MINKLVIDGLDVQLSESTNFPFTYTFSKSGVHSVRIGLENTNEVCAYAFKDCKDLTKVTFPPIIENIKRNAFENCSSLKKIDIPQTIKYIGPNVFDGCTTLSEINFESSTPPTFYSSLDSSTTCYIPTGSKFIKVEDNTTLVKDGSIQYYTLDDLGGYNEVDYESLVDDEEYYYDNWTTIHDHLNTIEEKNRIRIDNIEFVDLTNNNEKTTEWGIAGSGCSYSILKDGIFKINTYPENATNTNLYYLSRNPSLLKINSDGTFETTSNSSGRAVIYICTEPDYVGTYMYVTVGVTVENIQNIPKTNVPLGFLLDDTSATEVTVTSNDAVLPTLVNETDAVIEWSSSDTAVATVNEEGVVTIKGNGTTIIKALARETSTTKEGSAEYTLTVNISQPEPEPETEPSIITEYNGDGEIQLYNVDQSINTEYNGNGEIQLYNVDQSINTEYNGSGETQLYNTNND